MYTTLLDAFMLHFFVIMLLLPIERHNKIEILNFGLVILDMRFSRCFLRVYFYSSVWAH